MTTKTLSPEALSVIDSYLHFKVGSAVCSIPYFNNKTLHSRSTLNAMVGKGTSKEIFDEVETIVFKNHINTEALADESLKKLLVDYNIGIDCSALVFHTLNAEIQTRGKGPLRKNISFIQAKGLKGFIGSHTHPARLADVETFANYLNSKPIDIKDIKVADIVTIMNGSDKNERNHILVINQVDYDEENPVKIYYSHAVAYPENGLYGTGIKQGFIEVTNISGSILDQNWVEGGLSRIENRIFRRAQSSRTELRRLNCLIEAVALP